MPPGPYCGIFVGAAFDDLAAGADIGGDERDAGGASFQERQRLAFAEARQHDDMDLRQIERDVDRRR